MRWGNPGIPPQAVARSASPLVRIVSAGDGLSEISDFAADALNAALHALPELLAQFPFEDFAGAALGERLTQELVSARHLELRQTCHSERREFLLIAGSAGFQHNERDGNLAPHRIRRADDRGLHDRRMRRKRVFDLD